MKYFVSYILHALVQYFFLYRYLECKRVPCSNYPNTRNAVSKFLTTRTKMSSNRDKSDSEGSPEPDDDGGNAFANDGSFLEMFKRRMEEQKRQEKTKNEQGAGSATTGKIETTKTSTSTTKPALSSAADVPKASVNKPYQVVQHSSIITHSFLVYYCDTLFVFVNHVDCVCDVSKLPLLPPSHARPPSLILIVLYFRYHLGY